MKENRPIMRFGMRLRRYLLVEQLEEMSVWTEMFPGAIPGCQASRRWTKLTKITLLVTADRIGYKVEKNQ